MKIKKICYGLLAFVPLVISAMPDRDGESIPKKILKKISQIPDSLYQQVKNEDLLIDEVYIKLARDGWSQDEIRRIMSDYIRKNRKSVRGSLEYGRYAKQWLPSFGFTPGGDSIYQFIDTTFNEKMMRQVREAVGESFDEYYAPEPYIPDDRKQGRRQPGIFRPVLHKPSSGRIHWIHVHPENDDSIMAIPDGGGIFRTHDLGRNWECITDRIPVREHRNTATHSAIPVDPDDWNHIFAFMSNGNPVYETRDGGVNWRRIEGASHKGFKRGYCFRDKAGTLKFIGARQDKGSSYWESALYISEDTCKTWTQVIVPDSLKDIHPLNNAIRGSWFQQVEFDPDNRDMIYLPTSRSIFYFDDGAKSYEENGRKVYHLKKMNLRVFNQDSTELRSDTTVFPFPGSSQGFLNVNPNNPDQMWFAAGQRNPLETALYYSADKGANWITLQEPIAGIGSGRLYGNEAPWGWLGGFGVNFQDPNWIYGCSMSSAISSDGGRNFKEYAWGHRMKALHSDGNYYYASNSRHNADNHCIVSHKSGRVFRGSDGGMLVKDKNINNHEWTNIGSNMGQMLFYGVKVNEFGDQLIFGNTQDIDAQTYRYGRWGHWRGYEGSTCFTNPYSNTCYFSGGGGGGLEEIELGSWVPGYTGADVCTGDWYLRRTDCAALNSFYHVDDVGRSVTNISQQLGCGVRYFTLARDKGHATLFISCYDNVIRKSVDNGKTFTPVTNFTSSAIAADPDNSDILYLGEKGKVWQYNLITKEKTAVGSGLPFIDCRQLFFHEGSGDLYFVNTSVGIFIKEHDSDQWRLWMKGFNTTKFNNAVINYTTQEMVVGDYGRGVFVADLQNPADRYFRDGFQLKEISHSEGRRTIGIDTYWSIPLYYYYEWSVNGSKKQNPYQYLTDSLLPGDRVQLKLTLRESPDITTTSAVYTVGETESLPLSRKSGMAIASTGAGMVDLGYVDYFFNDFTIDLWVNPKSNGVILCNRQKDWEKGAKGWHLSVENETLRFRYAPANMFSLPTYETDFTQQTELNAGRIVTNQWHHVAITQQRDGNLCLYLDGVKKAEAQRILPEHTLNNAMNLGLFADGYERQAMAGAADELKIWNYALSADEIKQTMHSLESGNKSGLIYYNGFNNPIFNGNAETFSRTAPRIRKRAVVEMIQMPVFIGATEAEGRTLVGSTRFFEGTSGQLTIVPASPDYAPQISAYRYSSEMLTESASNLDTAYYTLLPSGYLLKRFDTTVSGNDTLSIELPVTEADLSREYRLYITDNHTDKKYWRELCRLVNDPAKGVLRAENISMRDLSDKVFIPVMLNPSIETRIPRMSAEGSLEIYDDIPHQLPLHARLLGNLEEPFAGYQLLSDNELLRPSAPLHFTKGEATGHLFVHPDHLPSFGQSKEIRLRGEDQRMIPFPIEVMNKISPAEAGHSARVANGGMVLGNGADYEQIHLSNTVSMMTWVRIDSATVLSGMRPLMMFRGGSPAVATGLHLDNGNIRCHWNEEAWSWGASTSLKVTSDHIGQWIHIALVARPTGMDYYLNGVKHTINRTINRTRIQSALMLGQNFQGDRWFGGAFDHTGVWNRSLTQEEVIRFMHSRVPLNDSALVVYANMDHYDQKGQLCELRKDRPITYIGNVYPGYRSPAPFRAAALYHSAGPAPLQISNGDNPVPEWYLTQFDAYPYNYVNPLRSADRPLKQMAYTFTFAAKQAFSDTDTLLFTFTDDAILADDSLTLALRPSGSEQTFRHYLPASAVAAQSASFRVPGNLLNQNAELMLFISPDAQARPVKATLSLAQPQHDPARIVLTETESGFSIDVQLTSYNATDVVRIAVKEKAYASLEQDTIDMTQAGGRFQILIDKEKLDKLAWNPVTVFASGAEAEPLNLEVSLEPKVWLRLKNGEDAHHFTATQPISTLEVEAELTQGVMDGKVELTTTADVNSILNTGNGTLLTDRNVVVNTLEHYVSQHGRQHEGWNLIGNPYLANINLTKRQNVSFDPAKVTKFIYQYNPAIENYETSDMTQFDQTQQIAPFQPYFVQTLTENAEIRITPVAKQTTINRKVFDYYTATERISLRLQLLSEGVLSDRTDLILEEEASAEFVVNEDAPKLESMVATANQLYTVANGTNLSVNTLPVANGDIPLGLKIGTQSNLSFRTAHLSGFAPGEIRIVDRHTGQEWLPEANTEYTFRVAATGIDNNRFVIRINRTATGTNEIRNYPVTVENGICTISGLQDGAEIVLYDIQGRIAVHETCYDDQYQTPLHPGTYLVKIIKQKKEFVTKIIVR